MSDVLVRVHISVESDLDEFALREKVEEALNVACSWLEQELPSPRCITYKIKGMEDLR